MQKDRNILVLYTSSICNLKCTYCFIDKSPALQKIDQILEESFQGDYYFNFAKEIFPDPKQLQSIEFWGGEPSLGLPRMYPLLPKFIDYYPNLNRFMMSTNLTPEDWFDNFWGFMDILGQYPDRHFEFILQLSLDGPKYINDANRGKGVTKKFVNNFEKLVLQIDDKLPYNVHLTLGFKPTYSSDTINKLQTKEKVIEYFSFYDKLVEFADANIVIKDAQCPPNLPNTACPSPHTKADGIAFANYCKITRELEKENLFIHYKKLTSFEPVYERIHKNCYNHHCGHCGSGKQVIGLLPDNKISVCHNGFTDIIEEYKTYSEKNKDWNKRSIVNDLFTNQDNIMHTCLTKEEFSKYEQMIECYYDENSTFKMVNLVTTIQLLALMNQIDSKYKDEKEAIDAADFYLSATSYCVRDGLNVTGTLEMYPVGLIKLLLNGAKEYILNEK